MPTKASKLKSDHSSKEHPGLDRKPGVSNWVDQQGNLPSYISRIAKHIHSDSGLPIGRAIAAAVNRVKALAAKGNVEAVRALAEWNAKKAGTKSKATGKPKPKDLSFDNPDEWEVVDLATKLKRESGSSYSSKGRQSSGTSGVRGAAFDETKHVRSHAGRFGNKLNPSDLIANRKTVEGAITNLSVGQTFELPDKLGWVRRTEGGYFVQGPSGYSASVRTLSAAIQAASIILAGKTKS